VAIELVVRKQPELGSALRLRLYGSCGDGVRAQIANFLVQGLIEVKGKIDRATGLQAMRESDVMLLIQNLSEVSEETIPSKVYEYLHTGRPILALVFRNPELKAMLQALGHTVVEGDDVEAVAGALENLTLSWQQRAIECTPTASPYTVERAAAELAALGGGTARAGAIMTV
jgi:glycosyltransferase involved in cell wall biosynthesis